ncbi:MAG: phenylacetate--CoA ligase family protein, partial [Kiritimatiellia bacterium]
TLEPVPDGEYGEIVITALVKEAFSLIRYRTRDIGRIIPDGPCPCGRTTRRMSRIIGRSDDMLIIRGVNVYPSEVETALLRVEGATPNYQIEVTRPGALDQVTVRVEMSPEVFSDQMTDMLELKRRIHAVVQSVTGLSMNIELVSPKTLERFEGKAKRVIDRRNLNHE